MIMMRTYLLVFKDGIFELWDGPIPSESNFHYAKFYGLRPTDKGAIWVLERTEAPENSVVISLDLGETLISKSIEAC